MNRRQVTRALAAVGCMRSLMLAADAEISRTAESIHQTPVFPASRKRVYELLVTAQLFDKVVKLSDAANSMGVQVKPGKISAIPGGEFSLFGGYVTGWHLNLAPNERIVQAWRSASWPAGAYSIATFVFSEEGGGTKIAFDHVGFPAGQAEHLAAGWHLNYWEPMKTVLAASVESRNVHP